MKKKLLFMMMFCLSISLLGGCQSKKQETEQNPPEVSVVDPQEESTTKEEAQEAEADPNWETWGTYPDYTEPQLSTTPIRYLSITVGQLENQINITWFSPSENEGNVYWTDAEDTEFEHPTLFPSTVEVSSTASGYYIHRATVSDLEPTTDFLYKVGNDEGMSPAYRYTTPAYSDTFRFTAVGDPQLGKPEEDLEKHRSIWHKTLNKVKNHYPDTSFLMVAGDQVNRFDSNDQYHAFLDQPVLYSLPIVPVKGNHDAGGLQYYEHFTLPNLSELGQCDGGDGDYWFVRGNVLFMVLDVIEEDRWNEHIDFIGQAVEENPDVNWKIIFSHYSPYNIYKGYLETGERMRPYFLEFTSKYDIDLVICGHNHRFSRSNFILGDGSYKHYDSPAVDPEGTMYLTLSTSSGSLEHPPTLMDEIAYINVDSGSQVCDIQVTPTTLTIANYHSETWDICNNEPYVIEKTK